MENDSESTPDPQPVNQKNISRALDLLEVKGPCAAVYKALLKHGTTKAGTLAKLTRVSRGRIYEVLDELIDLGMVSAQEGPVKNYMALQPEIALTSAVARMESHLQAKRLRLERLLPELELTWETPESGPLRYRVRIIQDEDTLAELYTLICSRARRSYFSMSSQMPLPARRRQSVLDGAWLGQHLEAASRCDDARLVVNRKALFDEEWRERVDITVDAGVEARTSDDIPMHGIVVDSDHVLVSISRSPKETNLPQLYVRHEGLARAVTETFEQAWRGGRPYEKNKSR